MDAEKRTQAPESGAFNAAAGRRTRPNFAGWDLQSANEYPSLISECSGSDGYAYRSYETHLVDAAGFAQLGGRAKAKKLIDGGDVAPRRSNGDDSEPKNPRTD